LSASQIQRSCQRSLLIFGQSFMDDLGAIIVELISDPLSVVAINDLLILVNKYGHQHTMDADV